MQSYETLDQVLTLFFKFLHFALIIVGRTKHIILDVYDSNQPNYQHNLVLQVNKVDILTILF